MNLSAKIPAWIQAFGAVILACIGFAFWCGRLTSDIGHLETDITRIDGRLNSIQDMLLVLRAAQLPKKVLQEIANLKPEQFSGALPALQKITEQPVATVAPEPATLNEVAVKLSTVGETTPDYWITTLRFIEWASAGMSPNAPQPGEPNFVFKGSVGSLQQAFGIIRGKIVVLDNVDFQDGVFDSCRIIFSGTPSVLKNIRFVNCVFEFPVTNYPPAPLKQMSEQLLAEGIQRAVVSLL